MTLDDKTKALIEAARVISVNYPAFGDLKEALAAFEPEPKMVYGPMPEFDEVQCARTDDGTLVIDGWGINRKHYNALRELTRQPKVEGREWWIRGGSVFWNKANAEKATHLNYPTIHVREVLP